MIHFRPGDSAEHGRPRQKHSPEMGGPFALPGNRLEPIDSLLNSAAIRTAANADDDNVAAAGWPKNGSISTLRYIMFPNTPTIIMAGFYLQKRYAIITYIN
jgi:hypothetical protein